MLFQLKVFIVLLCCLTFSAPTGLGELLPTVVLKRYSYEGVFLYRLCVSHAFGGRAGFDGSANHVFPYGVLAAITLVAGRIEMKGVGTRAL